MVDKLLDKLEVLSTIGLVVSKALLPYLYLAALIKFIFFF